MGKDVVFAVGRKKTPFQRHKELEEEKKKRADAEAAKVYEEFVDSFADDGEEKSFVRGGTIQPGSAPAALGAKKPGGKYVPSFLPPSMAASSAPQAPNPAHANPSPALQQAQAVVQRLRERDLEFGGPPDPTPGPSPHVGRSRGDPLREPRSGEEEYYQRTRASMFDQNEISKAGVLATPGGLPPQAQQQQQPPRPGERSQGKAPRSIDLIMERIKRDQEERDSRKRERMERGSAFDLMPDEGASALAESDPYSTNLYVGNLAIGVDEDILRREFVRFGPIASVKVMWPRDDDQRRRGKNCGFVAFMRREDAQRAKDELNNVLLHDNELKIGWGKTVVLPAMPLYTPNAPTHGPAGAAAARAVASSLDGRASSRWGEPVQPAPSQPAAEPEVEVAPPEDGRTRFLIDTMAAYVMEDGCDFEHAVMLKEAANPEYAFLFDAAGALHAYYRWRLWSLAQGDTLRSWRAEPFRMVEDGIKWVPPLQTSAHEATVQTAAQRGGVSKDRDRPLSEVQRDRFEDMLRRLTQERADVGEAMIFALDHAECATEVVEILSDSLQIPETAPPVKIARLMVVSDLLHNTGAGMKVQHGPMGASVRNASRYRALLEAALPDIFESIQEAYRAAESRMVQEAMRRHVLRVLRIWRSWFLFSDDYLNGLQATFLKPADQAVPENPALQAELEGLGPDDLELRCRRSGMSRAGGREGQMARLASLHAYLHADEAEPPKPPLASVKQEAVQPEHAQAEPPPLEGVFAVNPEPPDAEPAHEPVEEKPDTKPPQPVSKWTLGDYDEPADDKEDIADAKLFSDAEDTPPGGGAEGSPEAPPGAAMFSQGAGEAPRGSLGEQAALLPPVIQDLKLVREGEEAKAEEEKRLRLRKVEVAVLQLQEELEGKGLSRAIVDGLLADRRAALTAEVEAHMAAKPGTRPKRKLQEDEGSPRRSRVRSDKAREALKSSPPSGRRSDKAQRADSPDDRESKRAKAGPEAEPRSHKHKAGSSRDDRAEHADKERAAAKSKARDKEREKDREKDKAREMERLREKERARDKEREKAKASEKKASTRSAKHETSSRRSSKADKVRKRGRSASSSPAHSRSRHRSSSPETPRSRSRSRGRSPGGSQRGKERGVSSRSKRDERGKSAKSRRSPSGSPARSRSPQKSSKRSVSPHRGRRRFPPRSRSPQKTRRRTRSASRRRSSHRSPARSKRGRSLSLSPKRHSHRRSCSAASRSRSRSPSSSRRSSRLEKDSRKSRR